MAWGVHSKRSFSQDSCGPQFCLLDSIGLFTSILQRLPIATVGCREPSPNPPVRRGRLTTVGLRPPSVSLPRRHSHPDCRSILTLIVAGHRGPLGQFFMSPEGQFRVSLDMLQPL